MGGLNLNNFKLNENDIKSQNYLICNLHGFTHLTLSDNKKCNVNNELVKSIFISDDLKRMVIELQDNITYTSHKQEITNYLYHICFNLIIKTEICYQIPVYEICAVYENNKPLELRDRINIKDTCDIVCSSSAESIYGKILNSPTNIEGNFMKYERIFKTLHNCNIISQFMSLYQFLMELLKGNKKHVSQKFVINYLRTNKDKYKFLYFKKTRKEGENFEEDCFTYIRNEIGHSEETNDLNLYKELGSQIDQHLIKNLIIVINDIITTS